MDFDKIYKECSSMAHVITVQGWPAAATHLFFLVSDCNRAFNVYQPMTDSQIENFVEDILDDLKMYTIEDIAIFLHGVKRQRYGPVHSRFDSALLWEFWEVYAAERLDHFYRKESQHGASDYAEPRSGQQEMKYNIKKNLEKINKAWEGRK